MVLGTSKPHCRKGQFERGETVNTLHNQRGSALFTTLAVAGVGLLVILVLLDLFAIFVAKRIGQTAADAAALATLQTVEKAFEPVAKAALNQKVQTLNQQVATEVSQQMTVWEAWRRAYLETAYDPPLTEEEINWMIALERPGVRRSYRHSAIRSRVAHDGVAQALIDYQPVPFVPGLGEFFTDRERGCLVHQAVKVAGSDLGQTAAWFAEQNGATGVAGVTFPYDGEFKALVVVEVPIPLGFSSRFAPGPLTLLTVQASAGTAGPGGLVFDLSGPC